MQEINDTTIYDDFQDLSYNNNSNSYDLNQSFHQNQIILLIHEFCMPMLALVTFFLRVICVSVYSTPIKNVNKNNLATSCNRINKYLLINSIAETFVSFSYIFLPIVYCRSVCLNDKSTSYWSKVYYVYIIIFGSNIASMIGILANILMCLNRYLFIFNKTNRLSNTKFKQLALFLVVFSVMVNFPYLYVVSIRKMGNKFYLAESSFVKTIFGKMLVNLIALFRHIVLVVMFVILNFLLLNSSLKFALKKGDLLKLTRKSNSFILQKENSNVNEEFAELSIASGAHQAPSPITRQKSCKLNNSDEWNLTKMSLFTCFIYIVDILFLSASFFYSKFKPTDYSSIVVLELITVNLVQITNLFEIFSYFLFNKWFLFNFKNLIINNFLASKFKKRFLSK